MAGLELERGNLGAVAELLRAELRPAVAEGVATLGRLVVLEAAPVLKRGVAPDHRGAQA